MCYDSGAGFYGPMMFRGMHAPGKKHVAMCCPPFEQSKETSIKQLEAMKSHLEDCMRQIDEQIDEMQKEKGEEV